MLLTAFENIAGIASILGFLASVGALFQARRAATAAKQARDGVILRTLADELELASARMDQLSDFIARNRLPEAAIRAMELAVGLIELPYRRSPHLETAAINEILVQQIQIQHIAQRISMMHDERLSAEEKERILSICQECRTTLGKNLGIIKGKIDTGAA